MDFVRDFFVTPAKEIMALVAAPDCQTAVAIGDGGIKGGGFSLYTSKI